MTIIGTAFRVETEKGEYNSLMIIKQIIIENFRGIENADLRLNEYNLLVGANNMGKSTLLEALNLLLGPDRLYSPDAINEHDFYKSNYLDEQGELIKIKIECRLVDLSDGQQRLFSHHLEYWDTQEDRFIDGNDLPDDFDEDRYHLDCLRIGFEGYYDKEEDEFVTKTYFLNPAPSTSEAEHDRLSKRHKREIGYLYLRILRTGSRALSLERGSLLDIILQLKGIRPSSWHEILSKLRGIGQELDNDSNFRVILEKIEEKVRMYTPLVSGDRKSTGFEVTDLTRRSLRQSMNLFIGTEPSNLWLPPKSRPKIGKTKVDH